MVDNAMIPEIQHEAVFNHAEVHGGQCRATD